MEKKVIENGKTYWIYKCNSMDQGFVCGNEVKISEKELEEDQELEALYCDKCGNFIEL